MEGSHCIGYIFNQNVSWTSGINSRWKLIHSWVRPLRRNWPHCTLWTLAQCAWPFLFSCTVILCSPHTAFWIYIWPTTAMGDGRQSCGAEQACSDRNDFPNASRLLTEHRYTTQTCDWLFVRWNHNGQTEFAEHDAIITEQETIAYRDRTIISMWHEAIIVFRALSVKLLPGESMTSRTPWKRVLIMSWRHNSMHANLTAYPGVLGKVLGEAVSRTPRSLWRYQIRLRTPAAVTVAVPIIPVSTWSGLERNNATAVKFQALQDYEPIRRRTTCDNWVWYISLFVPIRPRNILRLRCRTLLTKIWLQSHSWKNTPGNLLFLRTITRQERNITFSWAGSPDKSQISARRFPSQSGRVLNCRGCVTTCACARNLKKFANFFTFATIAAVGELTVALLSV